MKRRWMLAIVLAWLGTSACAAITGAVLISDLMSNRSDRLDMFDAVLDEMDIHIDYVDEFMSLAEQHTPALHRMLGGAAELLDDPVLSGVFSAALTGNPIALAEVVGQSLGLSVQDDVAGAALALVLGGRAPDVAGFLSTNPEAMQSTVSSLLNAASEEPGARVAFNTALLQNTDAFVTVVARDPVTYGQLMSALSAASVAGSDDEPAP